MSPSRRSSAARDATAPSSSTCLWARPKQHRVREQLAGILDDGVGWLTESEVRYGTLSEMTLGRPGEPPPTDQFRTLTTVHTFSGIESEMRLIEGRFAAATNDPGRIEVVVPVEAARVARLKPGDRIAPAIVFDDCNRPPPTDDPVEARDRARFPLHPPDEGDAQRADGSRRHRRAAGLAGDLLERRAGAFFDPPSPTETRGPIIPIILPEGTFYGALPQLLPERTIAVSPHRLRRSVATQLGEPPAHARPARDAARPDRRRRRCRRPRAGDAAHRVSAAASPSIR